MIDHTEFAQYQQLLAQAQATLSLEELEWHCEIIDISLHGCLLRFVHTWEQHNIEAVYTLTIQTPESDEIIMNLAISHVIDNEVGFKCEHIENDLLLRQLVGTISGTDKLLSRELIELTHAV